MTIVTIRNTNWLIIWKICCGARSVIISGSKKNNRMQEGKSR